MNDTYLVNGVPVPYATLQRDYVCAVCGLPPRVRWLGGRDVVDCVNGHTGPFVTRREADRAKSDRLAAMGVSVAPGTKLTGEQVRAARVALYGDEA